MTPKPFVRAVPKLLTWEPSCEISGSVTADYEALLRSRLDVVILSNRECVLSDQVALLTPTALFRILKAPEVAFRLLWPQHCDAAESCAFLKVILAIETFRQSASPCPINNWSAEGDVAVANRRSRILPPIRWPAIDFESPYDNPIRVGIGGRALSPEERASVRSSLLEAMVGMEKVSEPAARFVRDFTHVVMIRIRSSSVGRMVSRSPERRPGLTVIENPLEPTTDLVDYTEALIHEAIHTLLDIDEVLRRYSGVPCWMLDNALCDGRSRAVSPWTGNRLDLPTYLQASFVWFGLVNFWAQAYGSGLFSESRVRERLERAAAGFLGTPILDQIADYRASICPEVIAAVTEMQALVAACLA